MGKVMKMHICFVVEGYPIKEDPFMPFVRELAAEMVRQGDRVSIIAPQSITRALSHKLPIRPLKWMDKIDGNRCIEVYQPYYVSLSKKMSKLKWTGMIYAAKRAYKRIEKENNVDALYAHFWHMGVVAAAIKCCLPIFVACGESIIEVKDDFEQSAIDALISRMKGVIYVGTKSYEEAKTIGLQKEQDYIIAPNGYNETLFYQKDRLETRRLLGWPEKEFIVSFVGSFNSRKGVDRLAKAINEIDIPVYSCFIGSGSIDPQCSNTLFKGRIDHQKISDYLCASDVFVLPTNNEGCCNAIVEALACGLPVISSNQSFNSDILDFTCSLQIDPMNIDEIKKAIMLLEADKELRKTMGIAAMNKAKTLTITSRACRIRQFIRKYLSEE